MAVPNQSHPAPIARSRPIERIPLLQQPSRQAQPTSHLRDPDPGNARQLRNHEPWTKQVVIHTGGVEIKGWAYLGGGRWLERVEVFPDSGYIWDEVPAFEPVPQTPIRPAHLACHTPARRGGLV